MQRNENIIGQRFGRLVVTNFLEKNGKRSYWECVCDCGSIRKVEKSHLKSGHTQSCGCLKNEKLSRMTKKTGLSKTKIHYTYWNMMNRCRWKNGSYYKEYGGRGICVCEEWNDKDNGFENFVNWAFENGYSEDLTLDRIDVNGNYCPENCRWVDKYVQANNKRNNHYVKINGEVDTVGNWARKLNISYWNLLHYSKGGKNMKYPDLEIEAIKSGLQKDM